LRARFPETRWFTEEVLHLTLVFLGSTEPSRVAALGAALASAAAAHAPFEVETAAAGGRPGDHRGGVAWLRLGRGAHEVADISLELDRAIGGGAYDGRRAPRPHLTVARRANEAVIAALQEWAQQRQPFAWRVDRLVLYRSHLGPRGSRYEQLAVSQLTGGVSPA
jgi:2'-5' RNA ligase